LDCAKTPEDLTTSARVLVDPTKPKIALVIPMEGKKTHASTVKSSVRLKSLEAGTDKQSPVPSKYRLLPPNFDCVVLI
jgi:hypothetical protein